MHQTKRATQNSEALQLNEKDYLHLCNDQWNWPLKKVLPTGCLQDLLRNMILFYTKVHLGMLSVYDMVGNLKTFQSTALVATASLLIMH